VPSVVVPAGRRARRRWHDPQGGGQGHGGRPVHLRGRDCCRGLHSSPRSRPRGRDRLRGRRGVSTWWSATSIESRIRELRVEATGNDACLLEWGPFSARVVELITPGTLDEYFTELFRDRHRRPRLRAPAGPKRSMRTTPASGSVSIPPPASGSFAPTPSPTRPWLSGSRIGTPPGTPATAWRVGSRSAPVSSPRGRKWGIPFLRARRPMSRTRTWWSRSSPFQVMIETPTTSSSAIRRERRNNQKPPRMVTTPLLRSSSARQTVGPKRNGTPIRPKKATTSCAKRSSETVRDTAAASPA
jgi:hypothetical protein